jgi:hypothetical protein
MRYLLLLAISILLLTGCATKCKQYRDYNYIGWNKYGEMGVYSKRLPKKSCPEITPVSIYDSLNSKNDNYAKNKTGY